MGPFGVNVDRKSIILSITQDIDRASSDESLSFNSDILETTRTLADAGISYDERLLPILTIIKDKADSKGRWRMENSLNGKMWIDVEEKNKPSRWITYHALSVIKHFEGIEI